MKAKALVFSLAVACLTSGPSAFAHPNDDRGERHDRHERYVYRDDDRRADGYRHHRHHRRHAPGAGPYHDLRPGDRLPTAFWDGRHHVYNWRRAGLPPPMPGCNWIRVGNDFVQSSVHTGKITAIVLRR